jgi:hypothetical protein
MTSRMLRWSVRLSPALREEEAACFLVQSDDLSNVSEIFPHESKDHPIGLVITPTEDGCVDLRYGSNYIQRASTKFDL